MGKDSILRIGTICTVILAVFMMSGTAHGDSPAPQNEQKTTYSDDLKVIITQVARSLIPAVVHIEVTQQQVVPSSGFSDLPQTPFFFNQPEATKKFKREIKGLGTGVLIDDKGYILTNNHVIEEASDIKVILSNGRHYTASIIGKDPKTDLAVIRVKTEARLPFAPFGDSDKVEVGEWVVAIGHPRGLDQTVTQGIISAKNRQGITDPGSYQDFLQTDAAINPGNSGGPLINLRGEVIGINSVIASESGGFEGIGFAIPSNLALSTAHALITYGKVKRGWIGVGIVDPDMEKASSLNMEVPKGAMVVDVVKGGPADRAGMKKGDVIVEVNGSEIMNSGRFRNQVAETIIGKNLSVKILRGGKEMDLNVTVGDLDESLKFLIAVIKDRLGVEVRQVKPQETDTYGIDSGVAVKWLDPKGPMTQAGFEVGDIILEVDGQMIRGMDDFAGIVAMLQPRQETILLALDHRSGQSTYVQVSAR
ncbi:MAG TPA: Do family serine endopeptidase [Deltaproteobacteria bacterium]|nr:Do family serine endopeptidase [Deltaproteobacteria bacterium]HPR54124.1 Do family serine endopeptidase [Deltaproteobacteria bacterium]HXK47072.1 Do family serine endopeptidase [Deltaproteobacteria bacterium]